MRNMLRILAAMLTYVFEGAEHGHFVYATFPFWAQAVIAAFGAIGWGIFSYIARAPLWVLLLGALLVFCLTLWAINTILEIQERSRRRAAELKRTQAAERRGSKKQPEPIPEKPHIGRPFASVCIVIGVLAILIYRSLTGGEEINKNGFHVEFVGQFASGAPWVLLKDKKTPMLAVADTGDAWVIQLLINLRIENLLPDPAYITSYSLDGANDPSGPWHRLCPVSMIGVAIFWAYDPKKALRLDMNMLDLVLLGKRFQADL